jgi:ATP-binding cassette subfamily F protein 3
MLHVSGLRKHYGAATILSDVTFLLNDGEHVGLIGPNGAGKSTILRCIVGLEQPDGGSITRTPADLRIGYLAQALDAQAGASVAQVLASAQADFAEAEAALQRAAEALSAPADLDAAMAAYDAALARFEALGGYEREHRAASVLEGLGLGEIDPGLPAAVLSGGQKTRLGLATLLLREPDLLLLDEPTNHLDVEALEWLEEFVRAYPRAVLVVSHDRTFLDRTVARVLYLDPERRSVRSYTGGYSDFAEARAQERALHLATWQDQQLYIQQVRADIARVRGRAQSIQNGPKRHRDYYGRVSAKVARLGRARERKLERYLDSDERVEKPRQHWSLKLDFGPPPPGGRAVLRLEELAFGYTAQGPTTNDQRPTGLDRGRAAENQAPRTEDQRTTSVLAVDRSSFVVGRSPETDAERSSLLLEDISFEVAYGERIALVGPNGAGKTTLLRLISGQLAPARGELRLGANVRPGVLAQEHETLDLRRSVLDTVLAARPMSQTEARNFLHFFLFAGDQAFQPVGACSLGERSRLQLALLVLRGCNLLLLDEPLNHLDIEGREHFEQALDAFEGTVIAVAHDRAFVASFADRILEVRSGRVREL